MIKRRAGTLCHDVPLPGAFPPPRAARGFPLFPWLMIVSPRVLRRLDRSLRSSDRGLLSRNGTRRRLARGVRGPDRAQRGSSSAWRRRERSLRGLNCRLRSITRRAGISAGRAAIRAVSHFGTPRGAATTAANDPIPAEVNRGGSDDDLALAMNDPMGAGADPAGTESDPAFSAALLTPSLSAF